MAVSEGDRVGGLESDIVPTERERSPVDVRDLEGEGDALAVTEADSVTLVDEDVLSESIFDRLSVVLTDREDDDSMVVVMDALNEGDRDCVADDEPVWLTEREYDEVLELSSVSVRDTDADGVAAGRTD